MTAFNVSLEEALKRAVEGGAVRVTYPSEWLAVAQRYGDPLDDLKARSRGEKPCALDLGQLQKIVFGIGPSCNKGHQYVLLDGDPVPGDIASSPLALAALLRELRSTVEMLREREAELEIGGGETLRASVAALLGRVERAEQNLLASGWRLEGDQLKKATLGRPSLYLNRIIEQVFDYLADLRQHQGGSAEIERDVGVLLRPFFADLDHAKVKSVIRDHVRRAKST